MSLSRSVDMSISRSVDTSICRYVDTSICRYVVLTLSIYSRLKHSSIAKSPFLPSRPSTRLATNLPSLLPCKTREEKKHCKTCRFFLCRFFLCCFLSAFPLWHPPCMADWKCRLCRLSLSVAFLPPLPSLYCADCQSAFSLSSLA